MDVSPAAGVESFAKWLGAICGAILGSVGVWKAGIAAREWWNKRRERIRQEDDDWAGVVRLAKQIAPKEGQGLLEEIHEIKDNVKDIKDRQQRMGSILHISLDGENQAAMYADPDGNVFDPTPLLVEWFRRSPSDIKDDGWLSVVAKTDEGRVAADYDRAIKQRRWDTIDFRIAIYDRVRGEQSTSQSFPVRMVIQPLEQPETNGFFLRLFRTDNDNRSAVARLEEGLKQQGADLKRLAVDMHRLSEQHAAFHPEKLAELEALRRKE